MTHDGHLENYTADAAPLNGASLIEVLQPGGTRKGNAGDLISAWKLLYDNPGNTNVGFEVVTIWRPAYATYEPTFATDGTNLVASAEDGGVAIAQIVPAGIERYIGSPMLIECEIDTHPFEVAGVGFGHRGVDGVTTFGGNSSTSGGLIGSNYGITAALVYLGGGSPSVNLFSPRNRLVPTAGVVDSWTKIRVLHWADRISTWYTPSGGAETFVSSERVHGAGQTPFNVLPNYSDPWWTDIPIVFCMNGTVGVVESQNFRNLKLWVLDSGLPA